MKQRKADIQHFFIKKKITQCRDRTGDQQAESTDINSESTHGPPGENADIKKMCRMYNVLFCRILQLLSE